MSINNISSQYNQMTANQGKAGDGGRVDISYENDILTFVEADGDKFTINTSNLSDKQLEELGVAIGAKTIKTATGTKEIEDKDDDDTDAQLESLKDEADGIESQIKNLSSEIKAIFDETLAKQEKLTEEECDRILEEADAIIDQYIEDVKSGKEVNPEAVGSQLMAIMENSDFSGELKEIFKNFKEKAEPKIQQMETLLGDFSDVINQIKGVELEQIKAKAAAAAEDAADDADDNGLPAFDADDNIFTHDFDVTDAGLNLSFEEARSATFAYSTSNQILGEKLEGHKEQFELISGFEDLDMSIMDMYKDYLQGVAGSLGEIKDESQGDDADDDEDAKVTKEEPEAAGTGDAEASEREEDKQVLAV